MSTPIETNTEDLREILQAVYDLKNSAGGGSSKPDLLLGGTDKFYVHNVTDSSTSWGAQNITYDPVEVISAYEKAKAGDVVTAVLASKTALDSYRPQYSTTLHASMVAASNYDDRTQQLMVYFALDVCYFADADPTVGYLKYTFDVDTANSTAVLSKTALKRIYSRE